MSECKSLSCKCTCFLSVVLLLEVFNKSRQQFSVFFCLLPISGFFLSFTKQFTGFFLTLNCLYATQLLVFYENSITSAAVYTSVLLIAIIRTRTITWYSDSSNQLHGWINLYIKSRFYMQSEEMSTRFVT